MVRAGNCYTSNLHFTAEIDGDGFLSSLYASLLGEYMAESRHDIRNRTSDDTVPYTLTTTARREVWWSTMIF